jgi:hypothetical protein
MSGMIKQQKSRALQRRGYGHALVETFIVKASRESVQGVLNSIDWYDE